MDLKNGYKKVYETAEGVFATKNNTCDPSVDSELAEGMLNKILPSGAFVYEKNGKIYVVSNGGLPSFDENGESLDLDTELFDMVTIQEEEVTTTSDSLEDDEPEVPKNPENSEDPENLEDPAED
jgi:hypothetical protein